ncbi:hypothetical protein IAR50_002831 [Cryptococcus sp. DSM 104548]
MPSRVVPSAKARNPLLVLPLPTRYAGAPVCGGKVKRAPASFQPSASRTVPIATEKALPPTDVIVADASDALGIARYQDAHDHHTYYRCNVCSLTGCYRGRLADDPAALNFHLSSNGHQQSLVHYVRSRRLLKREEEEERGSAPHTTIVAPVPLRPFGARSPLLKRQLSDDPTRAAECKRPKACSEEGRDHKKEAVLCDDHRRGSLEMLAEMALMERPSSTAFSNRGNRQVMTSR